jgi:hydroxymethylglutaryl-CoA lyase/(R)-citramalyl-CoA lyase
VSAVEIVDVGPRDGLQNAPVSLQPQERATLVSTLLDAGVPRVEAVSFVHPGRVPQMAGAELVAAGLEPAQLRRCCGLVLNERGFDRLTATGLGGVRFALAVSEPFQQRNSGSSVAEGLRQALAVVARGREAGLATGVVLATSFGCPFAGDVEPSAPLEVAARLAAAGVEEIVFADTIGVAVPGQVRTVIAGAAGLGPRIGIHAHNTRNTGYACTVAAIEEGAEIVDSSIGGLGGCPFAPGASGNISTEDLVYMLDREGIETGVDAGRLLAAGQWIRRRGLELDSALQRGSVDAVAALR